MRCDLTANEYSAALELGCTDFLGFDHRQRSVALAEELNVLP